MTTALNLEHLLASRISWGNKGLPLAAAGLPLGAIATQGWNLFGDEVVFPACVLKRSALEHNRATMAALLRDAGVWLAPHGKTTMSPQLFDLQLQDGAWALSAATPAHVMAYRQCGVSRILYANQLVDPAGIAYVLDELARDATFEFFCLVDSVDGARLLSDAVAARPGSRPFDVLVEIGLAGGRCGVRTLSQALELISAVQALAPRLRLRGVEAFEGVVSVDASGADQVRELLSVLVAAAGVIGPRALADAGQRSTIISVGGSAFVQLVASAMATEALEATVVLRSGCYVTNDHGMYARAQADPALSGPIAFHQPLQPALEVWGHVLSRPEPDRIIVSVGKRDISHDIDLPQPIHWLRGDAARPEPLDHVAATLGLNDQHAWLRVAAAHPIAVGDRVAMGCSHPCTTFDKWKYILIVDDEYNIVDAIATQF